MPPTIDDARDYISNAELRIKPGVPRFATKPVHTRKPPEPRPIDDEAHALALTVPGMAPMTADDGRSIKEKLPWQKNKAPEPPRKPRSRPQSARAHRAANRSQLGDTENPMPTFSEWTELNSWCIRGKVPLPPPEFLESPRYKATEAALRKPKTPQQMGNFSNGAFQVDRRRLPGMRPPGGTEGKLEDTEYDLKKAHEKTMKAQRRQKLMEERYAALKHRTSLALPRSKPCTHAAPLFPCHTGTSANARPSVRPSSR